MRFRPMTITVAHLYEQEKNETIDNVTTIRLHIPTNETTIITSDGRRVKFSLSNVRISQLAGQGKDSGLMDIFGPWGDNLTPIKKEKKVVASKFHLVQ